MKDKAFKTPYARISVFLSAMASSKFGELCYNIEQSHPNVIKRIHTDSFLLSKNIDVSKFVTLDDKLGNFKAECKGNYVKINNLNSLEYKNT